MWILDSVAKVWCSLKIIKISDILDISIVSYFIYKSLLFTKDTRTARLLKGLIIFFVITQLSYLFNLYTVNYILNKALQIGAIAMIVVFQPELRKALEHLGRTSIGRWFGKKKKKEIEKRIQTIEEIKRSIEMLSKSKIGALIIIERENKMGDILSTGINLEANLSAELLFNIFVPKTPLHDGAVIIRNNRIKAAACFLPLSQNPELSKKLGTRHRAGLGMSEESDCFVIIVSEETGETSVAYGGRLTLNCSSEKLSEIMKREFGNYTIQKQKK